MAFIYQEWKKEESEQRIINYLSEGDKTFSELLKLTDLSKPVLSRRLKELKKKGKTDVVPDKETKRFLYHLIRESLDTIEELHVTTHKLSKLVVSHLTNLARDSSISDEEYATRLMEGVSVLFNLRLHSYMVAPLDIQKEWLKTTLGLEFVRYSADLFPQNRKVFEYITKGLRSEEIAILRTKDMREAANQMLEFYGSILEKITRR